MAYDRNGNITSLERRGHIVEDPVASNSSHFDVMDDLAYGYYPNSNQLRSVRELTGGSPTYGFRDGANATTEYTYDANGNMVKDLNKGIGTTSANGIAHNHLNLPDEVKFGNNDNKRIRYIYDTTGVKLRKLVYDNSSTPTATDYAGNYVYEDGSLKFFGHPEGYVEPDGQGGFDYVYQYRDHLGNIRLSYRDSDGNGTIDTSEILEESNYYPFGLKHKGYNTVVNSSNKALDFKYNGVELEESLGLNLYEMELRQYDPAIARWTSIDPVTHHTMSPYVAFDNSPIYWSDPSGADSYKYNWDTKQYEQYDDDGNLINDNANYQDAIKWAENQNDGNNDEPTYASNDDSDSNVTMFRGTPFVVAGTEKVAEKVVTTTTASTATGMSATAAGGCYSPFIIYWG